ncbi:heterokaryon incompatibility protein-domain-containing protein [Trametes meyenii]|nr:heterokaryon incompatibility protein-domain-containing protein [Trametes meyenii]
MWLINTVTYALKYFSDPPLWVNEHGYAILSHCWDDNEITFADMQDLDRAKTLPGWRKVENACAAARRYHNPVTRKPIEWLWDDTCCIDKSSSAELSEAINSMFEWYNLATISLVYLGDVLREEDRQASGSTFRGSRWHTRGWTLQELVAANAHSVFLAKDWSEIGRSRELAPLLEEITGVDRVIFTVPDWSCHMTDVYNKSVARRMSWAAGRVTTRPEDRAYSLMGIFNVHMPIIYGEGEESAFHRLQFEIIQKSPDHSIFVFGTSLEQPPSTPKPRFHHYETQKAYTDVNAVSLLASSPDAFKSSADVEAIPVAALPRYLNLPPASEPHYTRTNLGIRIQLPIVRIDRKRAIYWALLAARPSRGSPELVGLILGQPSWDDHGDATYYRLAMYETVAMSRVVSDDDPDPYKFLHHITMDTSCASALVPVHTEGVFENLLPFCRVLAVHELKWEMTILYIPIILV